MKIILLVCPNCSQVSRLHPQDHPSATITEAKLTLNKRSNCNNCQQKFKKGTSFSFAETEHQKILNGSKGVKIKWQSGTPVKFSVNGKSLEINSRYLHVVTDSR